MDWLMTAIGYSVFCGLAAFLSGVLGSGFSDLSTSAWIGVAGFVLSLPIMIRGGYLDQKAERIKKQYEHEDRQRGVK